jgi:catechol 2,3-dioxygenase-like lactoylglutathione lyase family enzyme
MAWLTSMAKSTEPADERFTKFRRCRMSSTVESITSFARAQLVPELLVADIGASLNFWRDLCGFAVAFERPEEGFAYLDLNGAQVMIEERGHGRNWVTGALDAPLGRGVNFQVAVLSIEPILRALEGANWPLFMAPERKWYVTGDVETGVDQFLVQDPDGYLIRFSATAGERMLGAIGR